MDSAPALSMRDVVFRYLEQGKRNILDHVDLDIPAGRVTVLMGAGGCGKSTLAAVAAGLYPENGGFLAGGQIWLPRISRSSCRHPSSILSRISQESRMAPSSSRTRRSAS